jgi:hypothetical protein
MAPAQPTDDPTGLSTGAKVGIGVAVPVVVLALAGFLAYWLFSRRRRDRARGPTHPPPIEMAPHEEVQKPYIHPELDATSHPQELEAEGSRSGTYGYKSVPQELDTSTS